MSTLGSKRVALSLLVWSSSAGCVKVNSEFGDDASTTDGTVSVTSESPGSGEGSDASTADASTSLDGSTTQSSGSGSAGACTDPTEANDSEATAFGLPDVMSSPDIFTEPATIEPGDTDWYTFTGIVGAGNADLRTRVYGPLGSNAFALCTYIECVEGETVVTECPTGGQSAVSPEGRPGCCATAIVEMLYTCGGMPSGDVRVFSSVSDSELPDCLDYVYEYRF